ncbi:transmembrane and coiled-coil domain-containing protein STS1-like [Bidens hawaiensis]|uniref:transmembrane and coiled-coil domain-containing protein STS1-like n=1 Tax=Bidens hawaiensis TaxID=980011 RepID=UPI00404A319A
MGSKLTPTQRYAAAALFGLALNQAQIHQTLLLGSSSSSDEPTEDRVSSGSSSSDSVSEDPLLWVNESSGLLRPIFRFLEINNSAWSGLEETAGSSSASHHVGAFLRLLAEESDDDSSEASDHELALSNAINAMVASIETTPEDYIVKKEMQRAYADELQEKLTPNETVPESENQIKVVQEQDANKDKLKNEREKDLKDENFMKELEKDIQIEHSKNKHEKDCKNENIKNEQEKDCKKENSKNAQEKECKNENIKNEHEQDCKNENIKNEKEKDCKKENSKNEQEKACKNEKIKNEHEKDGKNENIKNEQEKDCKPPGTKEVHSASNNYIEEKLNEEMRMLSYGRKVTVLYELLSACLANTPEDNNTDNKSKSKKRGKGYDARHRSALRLLTTWFNIKWIKMEAIEIIVACSAMAVLKQEEAKEEDKEPKSLWAKWKRGGIIGAAALTGGTLMAISGGLAAPAIAAGFSALAPTLGTIIPVIGASGFAAVATAAGSVAGSVAVAASFGAAGAGLTGTKMARRTGSVDEFEFKAIGRNHNQGRLAVEILISGFVFEEQDFFRPWEGETDNMERYVLQWESKHLIAVSTAIQDWLQSTLALELMKRGAMMTVLSSLVSAFAWPATLLYLTDLIDSKWTIAVNRTDKAGKLLAEVFIKGLQGNRPVILVGFSLGARAIFKCLQYLAENGHDGIVERVVLLGAPVAIKGEDWGAVRKVVSGRLINAYSTNDWMLGVAFRASLLSQGLAGIQAVNVPGIENVDVTELIDGHSSYLWATQEILDRLELESYFPVFNKN